MAKAPAFQLYAADFYMDTLTWETDDIGVYFCLLMAEWVNGPLDPDTRKLAKIAKKTHQKFIKNWSKISQKFSKLDTGKLVNLRLEQEREKQKEYIKKQSDKGKKSAEKRSTAVTTTVQPECQPECQPEGNSSSSISPSITKSSSQVLMVPVDNSGSTASLNPKDQQSETPGPETPEPSPPGNTHGERWTETLQADLNTLGEEIKNRYGQRYYGRVQVWVQTNYNKRNPAAMVHCLRRLIQERQKGTAIPLPEAYLDAILNGNKKHPGENGKFEAEESARECEQHKRDFTSMKEIVPPQFRW